MTEKLAEVRRLLERYLVEVVEKYNLCPWARAARVGGEIGVEVLWGKPTLDVWVESARKLLAQPTTRVAMVIAPELDPTIAELRAVRDAAIPRLPGVGIADFHPLAPFDAASPARLVPYLRRSPDPMLQLVQLSVLQSVRGSQMVVDLEEQALIIAGKSAGPRGDVADLLAEANHERVKAEAAAVAACLADIEADRQRSYRRVGISTSR